MRLSSRRIAAVALVAGALFALLAGSALAAPPWSDAPNSYWQDSYGVTDLEVAVVADGYLDGTFKPTLAVNRGQFAKMAVNGLDLAPADPLMPTFLDVAKDSTFFTFVEGAYAEGLVTGFPVVGGLEYRPINNISRQQANSILGRYLSEAEQASTGVIHGPSGTTYGSLDAWYNVWGAFYLKGFEDWEQIAPVHRPLTAYLVYHGVVKGADAKLQPLATLTRSQAAVMILRVADEALEITTTPPAPIGLSVTPSSPDNDATPAVTGETIPGGIIHVYDSLNGALPVDLFAGVPDALAPRADANGLFTAHLSTLGDGSHVFTAKVKNTLGLWSNSSVSSAAYVLDTILPTGTIATPAVPTSEPDAAVDAGDPTFTVSAADERSGVDEVQFQVAADEESPKWETVDTDDEAVGSMYQADWSAGDLATGLADGQYLFRAVVRDLAGNEKVIGPTEVTVDTLAPTPHIAAGSLEPVASDGFFYTSDRKPVFGMAANDTSGGAEGTLASGVVTIDFLYAPLASAPEDWAGFTLISSASGASGSADYPPAGMPDGRYLFAVRATDRAGNQSLLTSAPSIYIVGVARQVVIDNIDPTGTMTAPETGWVGSTKPALAVAASDDTAGVKKVDFQYAVAGAPLIWIPISSDDTAPYAANEAAWDSSMQSLINGGSYVLRAIITDKSGRTYVVPTVEVTVDTTAPSGSVTVPAPGTTAIVAQPPFTAEATDAGGSGVTSVGFECAASGDPLIWIPISSDDSAPYAAVWGSYSLNDGGNYLLRAIVADGAGNIFSTAEVAIGVDLP